MSNFIEIIKECQDAGGAGSKKVIMAAIAKADDTAKLLIKEALDPYRVFGVKKYPEPTAAGLGGEAAYNDFLNMLELLATRQITGKAAQQLVTDTLGLFPAEDQKYLALVIAKDLKAGFSGDTVNKVFKSLVPSFEVMLADKCESAEEFEKSISFPCQADHKYDGQRTIALVERSNVTYYARSGKESEHLAGLFDEELLRLAKWYGDDIVLDGEAFASDFTETMNAKKEGNDAAKANLKLRAFFIMPLSAWKAQQTNITMREARAKLCAGLNFIKAKKIIVSEGRMVTDYSDMMAYCNEVIDVHKQEGLILKDFNATYEWDRTMAWCKVKRFYDVDVKIVDVYEGRAGTRLAGMLGGIMVEGEDEKGRKIVSNVGSGFSDELRKQIWENKQEYIGQTAVVKYQEISKAKNSDTWSLRFPTFEHTRDDK